MSSAWFDPSFSGKSLLRNAKTPRACRQEAFAYTYLAVICLVAATLSGAVLLHAFIPPLRYAVTLPLLFVAALSISLMLTRSALARQQERNLRAEHIFNAIVNDDAHIPAFTFLLRPYSQPAAAPEEPTAAPPDTSRTSLISDTAIYRAPPEQLTCEAQLMRALQAAAPLITLGAPVAHAGAGCILISDQEWTSAARALLSHARLILYAPSSRRDTNWASEQALATRLRHRTLIIDAPDDYAQQHDGRHNAAREWQALTAYLAEQGLRLPAHDPAGQLIHFPQSSAPRIHRLGPASRWGLCAYLEDTLALAQRPLGR